VIVEVAEWSVAMKYMAGKRNPRPKITKSLLDIYVPGYTLLTATNESVAKSHVMEGFLMSAQIEDG
jgi:hypothetical protein